MAQTVSVSKNYAVRNRQTGLIEETFSTEYDAQKECVRLNKECNDDNAFDVVELENDNVVCYYSI